MVSEALGAVREPRLRTALLRVLTNRAAIWLLRLPANSSLGVPGVPGVGGELGIGDAPMGGQPTAGGGAEGGGATAAAAAAVGVRR
eukprot:5446977-Prymnesium_polylepis.1